ncbi:tetratricopeptide repeat protein [Laspinema sp. A4]|uniref:tetratricopeptide repeat protein n=1 Tax=Laspinema sp. D2d TaxID=2953686 RepID=UPI0021BB93E0|nr:tetratricopeptide repeat protein [Laspinema sp. D2d]MCT7985541.1 tetratricopeptide repeat protein [Laspinema sp. D2d]
MKKSMAGTVGLGLGLMLLTSGCKLLEPLAIAQGVTCQQDQNQDTQNRLFELRDRAQNHLQSGKLDRATEDLSELFQRMQGVSPRRETVLMLIELVNGTQAQEGMLETLVDRLVAEGEGSQAESVLDAAAEVSHTLDSGYSYGKTRTLAGIARLYIQTGQRDRARATLARAILAETGIRGAAFKTKGLSEIARTYIALEDPIQASQILGRSLQYAQSIVYQDAYSQAWDFQPLAIYYGQVGQLEKALELAGTISEAYYRSQTFAEIAKNLADQGNIERAHKIVLDHVSDTEIKARGLAEIGLRSAKQGQTNRVIPLFTEAVRQANLISDPNSRMVALSPILIHYAEAGYPDRALQEITPLERPEIKAKVLNAIAIEYATQGQREEASTIARQALETVRTISESYEQEFLLMDMVRDYTRLGLYEVAIQAAHQIPYLEKKQALLLALATEAATRGDDEIAVKAAEMMPINLVPLAFVYQNLGQTERGTELLNRGMKAVESLETNEQKFEVLASLVVEYAKAGQQAKAEELFAQVLSISSQVQENSYVWETVFNRLLEGGLDDFTLQLVRIMKEEYFQSTFINRLVERFIRGGKIDQAYQVIELLKSPSEQVSNLIAIADQSLKAGERDIAREALDKAFDIAQTVPGEESKMMRFGGQYDAEGNWFGYTEVEDPMDRGSLYEEIAIRYGQLGEDNSAMQVVRSLESPTLKTQVQQRLACYR